MLKGRIMFLKRSLNAGLTNAVFRYFKAGIKHITYLKTTGKNGALACLCSQVHLTLFPIFILRCWI